MTWYVRNIVTNIVLQKAYDIKFSMESYIIGMDLDL